MMDEIVRDLLRFGFSDKEAKVYVALLEHGPCGAPDVAAITQVPRASCYTILDSLCERGLAQAYVGKEQRRYVAHSPELLFALVTKEKESIIQKEACLEALVPRLLALHEESARAKPRVRYGEGFVGLRKMQEELERMDGEVIQIVGYDTFLALHAQFTDDHRETIKDRGRRVRAILVTDKNVDFSGFPSIDIRRVSPSMITVHGEMNVCGEHVYLLSYANGVIALDIHSQTLADTCRATLELAWRQAGEIEKALRGGEVQSTK